MVAIHVWSLIFPTSNKHKVHISCDLLSSFVIVWIVLPNRATTHVSYLQMAIQVPSGKDVVQAIILLPKI